jgi:hypothetical protein
MWWYMSIIPAAQKAEVGGLQSEAGQAKAKDPIPNSKLKAKQKCLQPESNGRTSKHETPSSDSSNAKTKQTKRYLVACITHCLVLWCGTQKWETQVRSMAPIRKPLLRHNKMHTCIKQNRKEHRGNQLPSSTVVCICTASLTQEVEDESKHSRLLKQWGA